ncbi:hypothetical protein SESBI_42353 [Sesbania bispinosa]|nr:hypothetical protein SESBI_42353 [Sesbania bispinosa]
MTTPSAVTPSSPPRTTPSSFRPSNAPSPSAPSRNTCVYSSIRNPRHADVFVSASGNFTLHIRDVCEPDSTIILPAHAFDILACDLNIVRCFSSFSMDCLKALCFLVRKIPWWVQFSFSSFFPKLIHLLNCSIGKELCVSLMGLLW